MREVSISQLWGRAWDLFKVNWLLLVGLLVIAIIVSLISFVSALLAEVLLSLALIGALIAGILLWPALVRAGYLVARQGQPSFGEVFRDIILLLEVFVYYLILALIPGILIGYGYMLVRAALDEALREVTYGGMRGSMVSTGTGDTLVLVGYILLFNIVSFWLGGALCDLIGASRNFWCDWPELFPHWAKLWQGLCSAALVHRFSDIRVASLWGRASCGDSDIVCVYAAFVLRSDGRGGRVSLIEFALRIGTSLVFLLDRGV